MNLEANRGANAIEIRELQLELVEKEIEIARLEVILPKSKKMEEMYLHLLAGIMALIAFVAVLVTMRI